MFEIRRAKHEVANNLAINPRPSGRRTVASAAEGRAADITVYRTH